MIVDTQLKLNTVKNSSTACVAAKSLSLYLQLTSLPPGVTNTITLSFENK